MSEPVRLFSIPEVAQYLSISESSVYRLIKSRDLKTVSLKVVGKRFNRVRADDLQQFIDSNTVGATH